MYYIYKQPNSFPCVTGCEQCNLELIAKADDEEEAEMLCQMYLYFLLESKE